VKIQWPEYVSCWPHTRNAALASNLSPPGTSIRWAPSASAAAYLCQTRTPVRRAALCPTHDPIPRPGRAYTSRQRAPDELVVLCSEPRPWPRRRRRRRPACRSPWVPAYRPSSRALPPRGPFQLRQRLRHCLLAVNACPIPKEKALQASAMFQFIDGSPLTSLHPLLLCSSHDPSATQAACSLLCASTPLRRSPPLRCPRWTLSIAIVHGLYQGASYTSHIPHCVVPIGGATRHTLVLAG
jgi:hypothetical protein